MPLPAAVAAGIIGAASSLGAAGASAAATAGRNRAARRWQEQQFMREAAYNHPSQQYKRIVDAGLNPNLLYGGGGVQNTATMPNMTPETPNLSAIQTFGHNVISALMATKSMEKIDADIEKTKAQTNVIGIEGAIKRINKEIMEMTGEWEGKYAEALARKKYQLIGNQVDLMIQQTANQKALAAWNTHRVNVFSETGLDINKADIVTNIVYSFAQEFFGDQIKVLKDLMKSKITNGLEVLPLNW